MEQQQHGQPPSGGVPSEALAYLDAVRRYYRPGITRLPRNADIAGAHSPRLNERTWDRRKAKLRDGTWGGRDWIEVWPPPRDWQPSWFTESIAPMPVDRDGLVHLTYDEVYDQHGKLIERRLIRTLGHLGAVAAVFYALFCMGHQLLPHAMHLMRHRLS